MKNIFSFDFICQRQHIFPDDSCHVACLMMLLKFIKFDPLPSYDQLCYELNLTEAPQDFHDTSLENVIKYVVKNNIAFRMIFRLQDWKTALGQAPIMVSMYGSRSFWGQEGHAIILTKFEKSVFTYLDPWFLESSKRHVKTIEILKFYKHYLGFACQLLPKESEFF